MEKVETEKYLTMADYQYLVRRIDRIERKLNTLIAILTDKKIIGERTSLAIQESIVKWYLKKVEK